VLALVGRFVFTPRVEHEARERVEPPEHEHEHMSSMTSKAGWADAATYTVSDITMLRRELVIGYVVAGLLTVLVPMEWWNALFAQGHGFWTTLQNVIIGPFIAIISFVCSIGNVPMAAALWHGGISFGGVISFIFADLITFPLLVIYRKYYGLRITARLLFTFWAIMSLAGLAVEGIFTLFDAVPTSRPETIVPEHFSWNYTTVLNIVFLGVLAVVFWLARTRKRAVSDHFAIDPMCGMQVEKANAAAHVVHDGADVWFCSDHCRDRFLRQHSTA